MILGDYKTTDSPAPDDSLRRRIYQHGSHRQGATYIDGVTALGLAEDVRLIFLYQSKTAPYLVTPVELDDEALRIGRIENRDALRTYAECLTSGVWPQYATGPVLMGVPGWIEKQYEGMR
jgi:hypothetical protein